MIGRLEVRNTKALLASDSRICALVFCRAKKGKTTFAAGLDALTRKHRGKPTLIIASEIAEGGGTMTLAGKEFDYVVPQSWDDMEAICASLATNEQYGGVVLDNASDYVARYVKPHALSFPCKEKELGARANGVPVRSDYQVMGECARQQLNKLINLTTTRTAERFRKDLIVTALERENTDDKGTVLAIVPDLPGALRDAVPAMFQSVVSITIKQRVVPTTGGGTVRRSDRVLHVANDGLRTTDDRTGIFKHDFSLTKDDGTPQGLLELYDAFLERIQK